jgi:hypothetical protein
MKRKNEATVGVLAAQTGGWLLMTGFLAAAALITLLPFVLL